MLDTTLVEELQRLDLTEYGIAEKLNPTRSALLSSLVQHQLKHALLVDEDTTTALDSIDDAFRGWAGVDQRDALANLFDEVGQIGAALCETFATQGRPGSAGAMDVRQACDGEGETISCSVGVYLGDNDPGYLVEAFDTTTLRSFIDDDESLMGLRVALTIAQHLYQAWIRCSQRADRGRLMPVHSL